MHLDQIFFNKYIINKDHIYFKLHIYEIVKRLLKYRCYIRYLKYL